VGHFHSSAPRHPKLISPVLSRPEIPSLNAPRLSSACRTHSRIVCLTLVRHPHPGSHPHPVSRFLAPPFDGWIEKWKRDLSGEDKRRWRFGRKIWKEDVVERMLNGVVWKNGVGILKWKWNVGI